MGQSVTTRSDAKPMPVLAGRRKHVARQHEHAPERLRASIQSGLLIALLQRISNGEQKAEPHQVTAALGLLRKTLPDLQATLLQNNIEQRIIISTEML